jgi:hypothetical protein
MVNNMRNLLSKIILMLLLVVVVLPPKMFLPVAHAQYNDGSRYTGNVGSNALPASTVTSWQANANKPADSTDDDLKIECDLLKPWQWPGCWTAKLSAFALKLSSMVLYQGAKAFDWAINYSLDIAKIMKDMPLVTVGWKILLNITNLAYIFILLFVAICMILGLSSYGNKALIARIILTAVFVNFSLFASKVVVDFSNIAALQFYNLMKSSSSSTTTPTDISEQFMKPLGLLTIFSKANSSYSGGSAVNAIRLDGTGDWSDYWKIAILCILGSIFVITTAFVFLAGAFMFISRTLMLLFLMMFSSLAFAANVLPSTKSHFSEWSNKLVKNAMFAPIFIGLIYILVTALQASNLGKDINFARMILNGDMTNGFINFFMVQGAIVGVLLISAKSGVVGGEWAAAAINKRLGVKSLLNYGKNAAIGTTKGVATRTVGRAATALAESNAMKGVLSTIPSVLGGGLLTRAAAGVGKATGYEKVSKDKAAKLKTEHEFLSKVNTEGMSDTQKAAAEKEAKVQANKFVGLDENGKQIQGKWAAFKRFVGGKGTTDYQKAAGKKQKATIDKEERLLSLAEGITELTGWEKLIDDKGGIKEPNSEAIKAIHKAADAEKVEYDANGLAIKIGGRDIGSDSTLGKMYANIKTSRDPDTKRDLMNDYKAKVSLVRSKLKSYVDAMDKDAERVEQAAKEKGGGGGDKPKEEKKP